jgi:alpha-L-rhamnosidase
LGSDNGGHTGWADAAIVVPWTVYLNYGDKRILQDQYKSMTTWINFMKEKAGEDHLWDGDWHYGDWLSFDDSSPAYMGAYTETDLIATAYFAYSTTLMSKIARILDKDEDAKEYDSLSRKIKEAFNQEFLTPNGRLVSHTQTAYTLALAMDLIPENLREKVTKNFHKNVDTFKHITTGFLGTPLISQTLTDNGYLDMAYLLLNRKEYPSWLYPVTMGATTIWERWDGIKPDSTFQDAGMNSLNHYAYGAIGKWLYSTVAGIDIDEENPGYKNILIRPQPGGGLTHATAEIKTMYGLAASAWKFEEDQESFEVTIPPNTTATVYLPFEDMKNVRSDGKLISESQEMVISYDTAKKPFLKLGSGSYKFDYLKK